MNIKIYKYAQALCLGVLSVMLIVLFTVAPVQAKFPSKSITYIIPVTPGGGFDTASRMLIPYLKKYLPGNPNIIVRNIPGGEWSIGINKMYRARPDGHTVCILNLPGNAVGQVLGTAKYDLNKIKWIGKRNSVCFQFCFTEKFTDTIKNTTRISSNYPKNCRAILII